MVADKGECDTKIWEANNEKKIVVDSMGDKIWKVHYQGYPEVHSEWRHSNGRIISNSTEFTIINTDASVGTPFSTSLLKIHNPLLQHSGIYELVVSNVMIPCNKSEQFTLDVLGKCL